MRVLVLLPRFPYPLDKGDKLRAYYQIVELAKRHEVYLFALSHTKVPHDDYDHLHTLCTAVDFVKIRRWEAVWGVVKAFLTGKPLQLGYWTSRRARKAYAAWERQVQPDVVYCQMIRTLPTVEGSHYPRVLDFQDALSLNTRRRMERTHGPMRWVLNYEYHALQRTEQRAMREIPATTIIAESDRNALGGRYINIVPNGVDTARFSRESRYPLPTTHYSLLFTGNMGYPPNVDAAQYLVKEVMPLVWEKCPHATVLLAGADPKSAVRALASKMVTVSGRMPDIRTAYASAQVFVAPMRIGSGMQNKLLEAMAMQLPCVTTTLAANPLGITSGEHLLVGDTAAALADHIASLLTDTWRRRQLADAGHRFVQERYSWPAAVEPLDNLLTMISKYSSKNNKQ